MPDKPATGRPTKIVWVSDFQIEWLADIPEELRTLPRRHPATWQMVLLSEFEQHPELEVHIVLLRKQIQRAMSFQRNGVTFHVLKALPALRLGSLFWLDTLLIRRICRQIKPDLVHAWGSEQGAALIAARLGYPTVATVQGLLTWYKEVVRLGAYERVAERMERMSFPRATIVTTESSFAVRYLKNRYPRMTVHQAEHAPNWAFHRVQRRPQTAPVHFISVATLGLRKGSDLLFQALNQLAPEMPFKLTVISGPSPAFLESMRAQVSEELWQRIDFKTHLLPHEVATQLETPTMLLLPTRADTSPNAVKEAVVAGLPVVASEVGGIPDYVIPGKNGLLFPAGDLDEFVQAIRSACAHPLFGKGQVDPTALATQRAYLSPELMAKNFLAAYETAMRVGR